MTWRKRTIIELARDCGINFHQAGWPELERFAELVREDERNRTWTQEHWTEYERNIAAAEREACAKVCEELVPNVLRTANDASVWDVATLDCAEAIRARGEQA